MNWEFIVDSREKEETKNRTIRKFPENATIEALFAGDFACRQGKKFLIGIERKSLIDFVESVRTKRIFNQIEKLHHTYPVVVLILEGKMDVLRVTLARLKLEFNEAVFWGTIASIIVRDNFQIFWSGSTNETIIMAHSICKKMVEGKYKKLRKWKPKSGNKPEDALQLIPGVTLVMSRQLLKKYGSLQKIGEQTQKELLTNKNIGPTLTKRIKKFLCNRNDNVI